MTQPVPLVAPVPTPPDPNTSSTEPLAGVGLLTAAAAALLGVVVAFGVPVTPAERDAILLAIGPVAAVVVWVVGRRRVFSPASVATLLSTRRPSA